MQDYRPIQLILVDNGSTDESLSIARKFKEKNENEQFKIEIYYEFQLGAAAARNQGFKEE